MKKIFLALAVMVGLSACENGSYFDPETKQLKSIAVARIEATGDDFRVYEFTPQTLPQTVCIFVSGSQKSGLYCEPKKDKNVK